MRSCRRRRAKYPRNSNGPSASAVEQAGSAPIWLRIRRVDPTSPGGASSFSTWFSTDFVTWRHLGDVSFTMTRDALIGLALTSHKAGVETHAVFDDVRIER